MSLRVEYINRSFGQFHAITDLATIIFSTHRLDQVKELCEDILIINKGQSAIL
jgi:ABC-type multidrug transport system ATPase subunit